MAQPPPGIEPPPPPWWTGTVTEACATHTESHHAAPCPSEAAGTHAESRRPVATLSKYAPLVSKSAVPESKASSPATSESVSKEASVPGSLPLTKSPASPVDKFEEVLEEEEELKYEGESEESPPRDAETDDKGEAHDAVLHLVTN